MRLAGNRSFGDHEPATSVHGPKHVVKRGKTTVLTAQQARELPDSIDTTTLVVLRDLALMSVMTFALPPISKEVVRSKMRRPWLRTRARAQRSSMTARAMNLLWMRLNELRSETRV